MNRREQIIAIIGEGRDRGASNDGIADQIMGLERAIKAGDRVTYTMADVSGAVIEGPEPVFKVQWADGSTSWVRETQLLLKAPTHDQ